MLIASLVLLFLIGCYWSMFFSYFKGWSKLKPFSGRLNAHIKPGLFTLIVPFRDEEKNLPAFLASLDGQDMSLETQEIIFVDDHSTDNSVAILKKWIGDKPYIKCISLAVEGLEGTKKKAIAHAISVSENPYIITTDADTIAVSSWLRTVASFIVEKQPALVSAPVRILIKNGFFNRWQSLEFSGLIAIGAACMSNGKPNMCNGANLCYRKEIFKEVGGFTGNEHLLSGDDEFLMHKIQALYPSGVHFLFSDEAMVSTWPQESIRAFFRQRIRWTSKAGHYSDKRITITLAMAYLFTLSIPVFAIAGCIQPAFFYLLLAALTAKILPEFFFFRKILPFSGHEKLKKIIIPAEFLHVVYIVLIGVLGTFVSYRWKGRIQK